MINKYIHMYIHMKVSKVRSYLSQMPSTCCGVCPNFKENLTVLGKGKNCIAFNQK